MVPDHLFITITFDCDFIRQDSFYPGQSLVLRKEPDNRLDDEAIGVFTPRGTQFGHVANSVETVARGTHSAGYIYELFQEAAVCRVRFITPECAIAEVTDCFHTKEEQA